MYAICTCMYVAGTPYEGGMFRMKLVLSKDFPASPPQGRISITTNMMYVHGYTMMGSGKSAAYE